MRILVVPLDPLRKNREVGLSGTYLHRCFNPANVAEEVCVLDVHGERSISWEGFGHALLAVPPNEAMRDWMAACTPFFAQAAVPPGAFVSGFPGLPQQWLDVVRQYAPDLIRAYGGGWCGLVGAELGRALGIPSIVSVHDPRGIAPEAVSAASCVVAVSESVADECMKSGASPMKVVTIPDRVDRALFTPQGPAASVVPGGSPRLLCVARDCEPKNLDVLLEACAAVRQTHDELLLVHAGTSSRDWSRWPFVKHFDSIPNGNLPAWYRWADWFVLPSKWEGFGIVLAEALSCGTPCITSNRAPMNQIVRDGENGILCDPDSVSDLAHCIHRAVSEEGLRQRLALNARTSTEPFDIPVVERRESSLYRWIVRHEKPLLSIVMPTYNRQALVECAVREVLDQDYPNLELIVVNDGSSDGTAERLSHLQTSLADSRLHLMHVPHGGLPRALNAGFSAARGEFRGWIADDDHYRPGALGALVRELVLDEEAVLVHGNFVVVSSDRTPLRIVRTGSASELVRGNSIGPATLFRASAAQVAGGFDPSVELAEDYDFWVKLSRVGRFCLLDRLCYEFTDHPGSLSNARRAEVCDAALRVIERQRDKPQWRSAVREQLSVLARELKTRGLPWRSLTTAMQLIVRFPLSASGYWAAVRALTPKFLLDFTRRQRGLEVR